VTVALINGQPGENVPAADRGLQYGDGLFETISCIDGRPRWLSQHLERLRRGLLRLGVPFSAFDALQAEIAALAGDQRRCLIKVIVTRGVATRRGYRPSGDETPTRIVSRHEWSEANGADTQFHLGRSEVVLGVNPALAGLKHLNRLEQVLAQQRCAGRGWHEVLMLSATGHLISGSMSNVFLVSAAELVTPDLSGCGVEGVMRQVVMHTATRSRIAVHVRTVLPEELQQASEIFITNVRLGVQPVTHYEGRALPSASIALALKERIDAAKP
jgi:4-amino-4-deoxychorismate lyase